MNQNVLLAIATSVGLVAGGGGTWLAIPTPTIDSHTTSKAELIAAISEDPSLCPVPTVKAPTETEALAA